MSSIFILYLQSIPALVYFYFTFSLLFSTFLTVFSAVSILLCAPSKVLHITGTSLVAQWLRICLPVQGTQVRALVQEDPACRGATKLVCHNYWAHVPQLLKPMHLEPMLCNREATAMRSPHTASKSSPCLLQLEKARVQQQRPNAAIN